MYDRSFLTKLFFLIQSEYLTSEQYIPWCDSLIMKLDEPPIWLLDLSVIHSSEEAARYLRKAFRDEFETLLTLSDTNILYFISNLLSETKSNANWYDFLSRSFSETDCENDENAMDIMRTFMEDFLSTGKSYKVRNEQVAYFTSKYKAEIRELNDLYEEIIKHEDTLKE